MTRRSAALVAVVLPLAAIGFAIGRAEMRHRRAQSWVFEIGGFDPRDLLRGRYLQFRLRVDEVGVREPCDDASDRCCLCLTRTADGTPPVTERATCASAVTTCDGALQTGYLGRQLRYYVPEARAADLDRRLATAMTSRRAQVVLAIDRSGDADVRALILDGETIPGSVER